MKWLRSRHSLGNRVAFLRLTRRPCRFHGSQFRRSDANHETCVLNVPLLFDAGVDDGLVYSPSSFGGGPAATCPQGLELSPRKEQPNPLRPKTGAYRRPPGFAADLVCISPWMDGEPPGTVTALCVNSAYGLCVFRFLFLFLFLFLFYPFHLNDARRVEAIQCLFFMNSFVDFQVIKIVESLKGI